MSSAKIVNVIAGVEDEEETSQSISELQGEGERSNWLAIARMERPPAIPREISSRSESVNANLDRCLRGGRIPPARSNWPAIDE